MKLFHTYIKCFLLAFFLFSVISNGDCEVQSSEDQSSLGRNNFYEIKEFYDKWDLGLYGSRKYYRGRLTRLLNKKIGKYIQTEMDYRISVNDMVEKKYYSSDLYNHKWLIIHGTPDKESLKFLLEKGDNFIEDVELRKYLFFLSGKIKKFRILESDYGRSLHIYLESVKITDTVNQ